MESEPNFEGEEMKLPSGAVSGQSTPKTALPLSGFGLIIGALFALLLLLLAGLAYWYYLASEPVLPPEPISRPTPEMNNEPESTTAEAQVDSLGVVSTSDELDALEADIESTNLDTLDAELRAIDAEMEAALRAQNQ